VMPTQDFVILVPAEKFKPYRHTGYWAPAPHPFASCHAPPTNKTNPRSQVGHFLSLLLVRFCPGSKARFCVSCLYRVMLAVAGATFVLRQPTTRAALVAVDPLVCDQRYDAFFYRVKSLRRDQFAQTVNGLFGTIFFSIW